MNDKEWGLVDCSSIIVSSERELTEVFTTDRHFKQAGFTIFLEWIYNFSFIQFERDLVSYLLVMS